MAISGVVPVRRPGRGGLSALLGLIVLLLSAIAAAVTFTAYLLRTSVLPVEHHVPPLPPAPFRVLYLQHGQFWSVGPDGTSHPLSALRSLPVGGVRAAAVSPDGRRLLLIAHAGAGDSLWLLQGPGAASQPIPLPAALPQAGPWTVLATSWTGGHSLALLLSTAGEQGRIGVERYSSATRRQTTFVLPVPQRGMSSAALSLSPAGDQVALADSRPAKGSFAGQIAVRLQHINSSQASIAFRYLGSQPPTAVAWSPDGGTVAIQVLGMGLVIQKSSGRPVHVAPDGRQPAAFSQVGAQFAYLAGRQGSWTIHVLALHGEAEHLFGAPSGDAPVGLWWSPDARALLYASRGSRGVTLWQIEPVRGHPTLLSGSVSDSILGSVPAGAQFGQ